MFMQRFKILVFSILFIGISNGLTAKSTTRPIDSINVAITLNWNSSVTLTRNQKGQYSGKMALSIQQTSDTKTFTTSEALSPDTASMLLQKILDLGLLDVKSSELEVIDGFRTTFTIMKPNDERKVSLVAGVANDENSKRAGNIINFLSTNLNIQHKLFNYLNTLPAGRYTLGMRSVKVHQLLPIDVRKSSLYRLYEDSFKNNRIDIPLFVINGKVVEPIELNNYELEDIIKTETIKGAGAAAIYGLQGANGAVVLTSKK